MMSQLVETVETLLRAGLYAFVIYWGVSFVRALPKIEGKFLMGRKPWGCNLCMTTWGGIALGVLLVIPRIVAIWVHEDVSVIGGFFYASRVALGDYLLPLAAGVGMALYLTRKESEAPSPEGIALERLLSK